MNYVVNDSAAPFSRDAFIRRLRGEGECRYHDRHPFHVRMNEGKLSQRQLQGWVANRFYYQTRVPIKDALILSKSEDPTWRRVWLRRIVDQDGIAQEGGLARWLHLAQGVGLDSNEVSSLRSVLPAVRFACDAYVQLVREGSLLEAVAASLTELFAPELMARRLAAWEVHYPWVQKEALAYFQNRIGQARTDSGHALDFVIAQATTRELQEACVTALVRKCEILWTVVDAIDRAYPEGD